MEPRHALITGAGRGIGRAVAVALAREGLDVSLLARSGAELDAAARECRVLGVRAFPRVCDLLEPDSVDGAVRDAADALGPVDVLVSNAGVFLDKPVTATSLEEWRRVLDVNLTGAFVVTKAVLPSMIEREFGIILQVASTAGLQGYHGQSAYCASKHGMLGFARALQLEVQKYGIRVHALCPGGVETEFIAGTALADRLKGQVMIQPEDMGRLAAMLVRTPMNVALPEIEVRRFQR